jgi:hypothetical protein
MRPGEDGRLYPFPEMQITELRADNYPGKVMRALLGIREVCLIVALVLVSILMVLLLAGIGRIANAISQDVAPSPTPTECFENVPC